ncbi:MAG: copper transporter, partial [Firmicutes bacterium]|nr:copper transporter [Bacillota bacterium]
MYMGFRYHLASLVAVFFSLLLGILIGGALFQDDRLVEEQGLLIADMELQFRELQSNLQQLLENEKLSQTAWEQVKHSLAKNRLAGQTVILVTEEKTPDWQRVKDLLSAAGACIYHAELSDFQNAVLPDDVLVLVWLDQDGLKEDYWTQL